MPVILPTQETEIRRIMVPASPAREKVHESLSLKPFTNIGLVEWLKMKALSSNPSSAKNKKPE
jgi:hypothetical protein